MPAPVYIIDTSCLTQAHRMYYPFDIARSFWSFMKTNFDAGNFILTNKVESEISKGKDALTNWIDSQLTSVTKFDCHGDASVMMDYGRIMTWGNSHAQYTSLAKQEFSDFENADPFVVATGLSKSAVVVSQEVSAPGSKKSIKLPDICMEFDVEHIDTFTLLRRCGFTM